MKRSKLAIAASAVLLAVGGFVATKAHAGKHHSSSQAAYYQTGGSNYATLFSGATNIFLTTNPAISGKTARINTGSNLRILRTGPSSSALKYYFK
jgi:hypothetical protein